MRYRNKQNQTYVAGSIIGHDDYFVARFEANGRGRRVSHYRTTLGYAQAELDRRAKRNGWTEVQDA